MLSLELVRLTALMTRTRGNPEIKIGIIDGPVLTGHVDLEPKHLRQINQSISATCTRASSASCLHGTFVTGILSAKPGSNAPSICPNCTLLIRPIFVETTSERDYMPSATPLDLAAAIHECIDAGARIINLSLGLAQPSSRGEKALEEALHHALARGVIVVAAAGNQGTVGSSAITRHHWVIPVTACDLRGRPLNESNFGNSIGRRGLSAPGDNITSLGSLGQTLTLGGTSVAVPFVTGAIALLWSEFPDATAAQLKLAITQAAIPRRATIVPPLLDAEAAYKTLSSHNAKARVA